MSEETIEVVETRNKFLVGSSGLFEQGHNKLFKFRIKARKERLAALPKLEEEATYDGPPIPCSKLKTALGFFEHCYKEHKAEGCLLLRLNPSDEWELVCPKQYVGGAHVCYHPDQIEASGVVGDIHSHPDMGKGHSGTDHIDEAKYPGLAIVVNRFRLIGCDPEIIGSVHGVRFKFDAEDIFDETDIEGTYDFPEEWKEKVIPGECPECEVKYTKAKSGRSAGEYDWSDGYDSYDGPPYNSHSPYRRSYVSPRHYSEGKFGGSMYYSAKEYPVAAALREVMSGRKLVNHLINVLQEEQYLDTGDVIRLGEAIAREAKDIEDAGIHEDATSDILDVEDVLSAVGDVEKVECPACSSEIETVSCSTCHSPIDVSHITSDVVEKVRSAEEGDFGEEGDLDGLYAERETLMHDTYDDSFPLCENPAREVKEKEAKEKEAKEKEKETKKKKKKAKKEKSASK